MEKLCTGDRQGAIARTPPASWGTPRPCTPPSPRPVSVCQATAGSLFCRFLCERRVASPEGLAAFAEWTRDSPAATALYALEPPNPKDGARALAFRRAGGKEEEAGAGVAEAKATAKRGPAKGKKAAAQGESPAAVEEDPAKARTKRATGAPKATPQAKRGKK